MSCWIPDTMLAELLDGRRSDALAVHAAECPACGKLLDELERLVGALGALRSSEPPPQVVQRASALLRPQRWLDRAVNVVRTALALDTFGLQPVPVRSAAEGAAAPHGRYLRFEAAEHAAELHVLRDGHGAHELTGRLLRPEREAPFAVLVQGSQGASWTRWSDAEGQFEISDLPPDRYELRLELDSTDVLLGPLALD